jgi:hypothetical protein
MISDIILNSVTAAATVSLPDTCAAIHQYTAARPISGAIISPEATANLLCVPTRMAGFMYTCVAAGLEWMKIGIGTSALTFFAGAVFVVIFIRNIWLFAVEALGVISSLFLAVMLLPFTAIAECFNGKTNMKDPDLFSRFFEMLTQMLGNGKLKLVGQLRTFIDAAIYYIILSIVASIGLALLAGVAQVNFADAVPTVKNNDFMMVLIVGALVSHLANKAGSIAKDLGGAIEGEFGKKVGDDLTKAWKGTKSTAQSWYKAYKKS